MNTVIQNPEIVGTAFKSMSARLRGATTELEEMGETEEGVADTTAKLQSLVKGLTGFDIMENDKQTFKDIYDIMIGIGEQWDNLTDVEQASLSEALFGKRNSNVGFSVLQNIDTLKSVYKTAEESQGSALREQENYNESIQAHINQAKASLEELLYTAIDSGAIKDILDAGKGILDFLTKIIDNVGLLNTLLPITFGVLGGKNKEKVNAFADDLIHGDLKLNTYEQSKGMEALLNKAEEFKGTKANGAEVLANINLADEEFKTLTQSEKLAFQELERIDDVSLNTLQANLQKTGTIVGKVSSAFKALGATIKAAAMSFVAMAVIELIASALSDLFDGMESLTELNENIGKDTEDITSNTEKVSELIDVINDESSTVEEIANARKELLSIQDKLNEKYGTEVDLLKEAKKYSELNFDGKLYDTSESYLNDLYPQETKPNIELSNIEKANSYIQGLRQYIENMDESQFSLDRIVGESISEANSNIESIKNGFQEFGDSAYRELYTIGGYYSDFYNAIDDLGNNIRNYLKSTDLVQKYNGDLFSFVRDGFKDIFDGYLEVKKNIAQDEADFVEQSFNTIVDAQNTQAELNIKKSEYEEKLVGDIGNFAESIVDSFVDTQVTKDQLNVNKSQFIEDTTNNIIENIKSLYNEADAYAQNKVNEAQNYFEIAEGDSNIFEPNFGKTPFQNDLESIPTKISDFVDNTIENVGDNIEATKNNAKTLISSIKTNNKDFFNGKMFKDYLLNGIDNVQSAFNYLTTEVQHSTGSFDEEVDRIIFDAKTGTYQRESKANNQSETSSGGLDISQEQNMIKYLSVVQSDLVKQYGDTAKSLDLFKNSSNGASEALSELAVAASEKKISDYLGTHEGTGIEHWGTMLGQYWDAIRTTLGIIPERKSVTLTRGKDNSAKKAAKYYDFSSTDIDYALSAINDYMTYSIDGIGEVSGNAYVVQEKLKELKKKYPNNTQIDEEIKRVSTTIAKYGELAKAQEQIDLKDNEPLKALLVELEDAKSDYETIKQSNGEDSKEAQIARSRMLEEYYIATKGGLEGISNEAINYLKTLFPELEKEISNWKFEVDFENKTEDEKNKTKQEVNNALDTYIKAKGLEGKSQEEIINAYNKEKENINNFNPDSDWNNKSSTQKEQYVANHLDRARDFLGEEEFERVYGDYDSLPTKENLSALVEEIDKIYFGFNSLDAILSKFGTTIETIMRLFGFGAGIQTQEQQNTESAVQTAFNGMPNVSSDEVTTLWNGTTEQGQSSVGKNVSGFINYVEQYRQSGDDLKTAWSKALVDIETKADATFSEIANKMQKNLKNLDSLGNIYSDVQDGGDFDWSKLLNNEDFNKTFGSMGAVYSDFIKTVSDNPSDIQATQDAFNGLVNAWMMSNGVLDNLTAETKANAVAQMEQAGITNAETIATNKLTAQEQYLAEKKQYANQLYSQRISLSGSLDEATMSDIQNLVALEDGLNASNGAMVSYIIQKQTASGTFLDESSNIAQLQALGNVALGATASMQALNQVMGAISTASKSSAEANWEFGTTENYYADAFAELGYDKSYVIGKTRSQLDAELQNIQKGKAQNVLDELKGRVSDFSFAPTYAPSVSSGGSGSGGSGGGSGDGGGGGGSDAIDEAQEKMDSCTTIDHIETKLKRIEREISRLDKMADRVYIGWQERNNKLGESFSQVGREIQAQTDGFWYYLAKANEVGLDDWHKSLVNNGCTNIETFADDDLKRRIDDYQTWYEKALDCADAIEDLKDKQAELMKQQFDNIGSQYDQLITRIEKANDKLEGWITLQETQGHLIANGYYGEEIHNEQKRINQLNEERDRLQAQLNCTVNQGQVGLFSEEWYEMSEAIMDVDLAIQEATNSMAELNKKMRENSWEIFDKKMDWESKVKDESDFIIDALSTEKLFNDNGTFNNYGSATVGLRAANYDMAMRKAQDYKKAIQEVEAEMRKEATTNVLLEERKQELISAQQEAIKSAMDEKESIKDLVKEGYDTLIDYLNKLIDKYKKTLEAQKNLYDYEKNIRNQTKAIADYRKQLMALGGDDSEENKARLQQLQESLREAEEERQDTEYEKWLDDQQVILDDMMEGLEDWIEKKLERVDEIMAQQIAAVNDNKTVIRNTINEKTKDLGYTMTTQLQSVVDNMKVSDFHKDFLIRTNSIIGLMNSFDKWFEQMVQISEKQSTDNRGCTSQVNNGVANNGCSSADQDKSWVNMVSKNPQPANNGCSNQQPQNDGCSNQQPQNNGCSNQQPQNDGCSNQQPQNNDCSNQQPQNDGCSNQQPQNNDCTQQNNNGCTQYATGRHDGNKELAWTQENGREAIFRKSDGAILTPLGKGDKVFTNAQTEALWNISKGLVGGVNGVPVSNVSATIKAGDSNVTFAGDINLVGVENPQQFSEQLRNAINNDEKVKKTLQANTLGVAMGKNSLLGKSIR